MREPPGSGGMQRLHPASLFFRIGPAAKRLLLPGLAVLLLARGGRYETWLMVMFVPAAIGVLAGYLSYRYRLGTEELVVRHGIITRNERHIPYERIQNINLVQNPLHRFLGVAEVRLETASGEEPEAVMRVLSLNAIETMRDHVFRREARAGAVAEPDRVRPLYRLTSRELILLGLVGNRGVALVAAAAGLLWQLGIFDRDDAWLQGVLARLELPAAARSPGTALAVGLALGGAATALLVLKLLSVVWTWVKFHGFTLSVRGGDLRAEYGLLTRISATIPRRRIQLLSIRRGPVQRWLGRASVQVETAGQSRKAEGSGVERQWLAPLIEERRLGELLHETLPGTDLEAVPWRPVARRAWRRIVKRGAALALLVAAAAGALLGPWGGALLLPGALLAWLHSRLYVRHAAYALAPEAAVYRSGWWTRQTSIVPYGKVQTLALEESPFDRRSRMASVLVDTAGAGRIGHRFLVRYLEAAEAAAVLRRLAAETSAREFRW